MDTLAYDIEQISIAVYSLADEARGGGDNILAINLEELSKSLNGKVTEVRQLEAENARLREAHQELYRLARDVANHVRDYILEYGGNKKAHPIC